MAKFSSPDFRGLPRMRELIRDTTAKSYNLTSRIFENGTRCDLYTIDTTVLYCKLVLFTKRKSQGKANTVTKAKTYNIFSFVFTVRFTEKSQITTTDVNKLFVLFSFFYKTLFNVFYFANVFLRNLKIYVI